MVNYKNSKIYKIVCNATGDVYFGSTTQKKLSSRMNTHRKPNSNLLSKIIIQRHNYSYCLVEQYECENHDELYCRLRYYVDNYDCINKQTTSNNKHIDNQPPVILNPPQKHTNNQHKRLVVNPPQKQQHNNTPPMDIKLQLQKPKEIQNKNITRKRDELNIINNVETQTDNIEPPKKTSIIEPPKKTYIIEPPKRIDTNEASYNIQSNINNKIDDTIRKEIKDTFNKTDDTIRKEIKDTFKKAEYLCDDEDIKYIENEIKNNVGYKEKTFNTLPTAQNFNNNKNKSLKKHIKQNHNKTLKITDYMDILEMKDILQNDM